MQKLLQSRREELRHQQGILQAQERIYASEELQWEQRERAMRADQRERALHVLRTLSRVSETLEEAVGASGLLCALESASRRLEPCGEVVIKAAGNSVPWQDSKPFGSIEDRRVLEQSLKVLGDKYRRLFGQLSAAQETAAVVDENQHRIGNALAETQQRIQRTSGAVKTLTAEALGREKVLVQERDKITSVQNSVDARIASAVAEITEARDSVAALLPRFRKHAEARVQLGAARASDEELCGEGVRKLQERVERYFQRAKGSLTRAECRDRILGRQVSALLRGFYELGLTVFEWKRMRALTDAQLQPGK